MSKPAIRHRGQPATDLIEEAIRLLRRAPFRVLLTYFVGAVPAPGTGPLDLEGC